MDSPRDAGAAQRLYHPIQALRHLPLTGQPLLSAGVRRRQQGWGRYSFLGFEPSLEVTCKDGIVQLKSETGETETRFSAPRPGAAGTCWPGIKAPGSRACPPSPADWWATSPMTTSSMPNPVCT